MPFLKNLTKTKLDVKQRPFQKMKQPFLKQLIPRKKMKKYY